MQYILIFLAVLLVVLFMNFFIFTALRQIVLRTKEQIGARFLRELSVFDDMYEDRAAKLEKIREDEARANSNIMKKDGETKTEAVPAAGAAPVQANADIPVSNVSSPNFYEEYRYVKNAFRIDRDRLVGEAAKAAAEPEHALGKAAAELLSVLTEKAAFQLSTMEPGEQLLMIRELLGANEALLSRYLQETGSAFDTQEDDGAEEFDVLSFYSWLRDMEKLYSDRVLVYTSDRNYRADESKAETVYDDSICEGIRIRRGSRLYDYSL